MNIRSVKERAGGLLCQRQKNNVKKCFYGHLHGVSIKDAFEGEFEGIEFKLVSADGLNFKLYKIFK